MATRPESVRLVNPAAPAAHVKLTGRQQQVVKYVAEGETTAAIAKTCFLSEYTVKAHLRAVRKKLGVSDASALVNTAYETEAIPMPGPLSAKVAVSGLEQQVLQLISLGHNYSKIASELEMSRGWVREMARRLRSRLDARNRPHLVTRARQLGLLGARPERAECNQLPQETITFAVQPPSPGWRAPEPEDRPAG
jgi:DNA-binding NarL/FixJ family response regulator